MCECRLQSCPDVEPNDFLSWLESGVRQSCPDVEPNDCRGISQRSCPIVEPNDRCELTRPCPVWEPSGRECTIVVEYFSGRVQLWSRTTAASWPGRVLFGSRAAGSVFMGLHWFACLSRLWWKFLMLMFHTVIWILFPDIVAWSSNDVLENVAW
jgi:hypothetical protein